MQVSHSWPEESLVGSNYFIDASWNQKKLIYGIWSAVFVRWEVFALECGEPFNPDKAVLAEAAFLIT